jgi:dTDP-4-dehydrorhamnose 3,5-epimerase-like enzyme
MKTSKNDLWQGLDKGVRKLLSTRDYQAGSFAQRLAQTGVAAGEVVAAFKKGSPETRGAWIPGVEIFPRTVHAQRHRGIFGEFARRDEGVLAEIGLWPAQWATARMFARTAKGFHVHPPFIPAGKEAAEWLQKLFVTDPRSYSSRLYRQEQWDVIFFVQGVAELILRDVRIGLPHRTMRLFVDGDNHRSDHNVGIVIPPGVAHAIRAEGAEDVIMVYGTSTSFRADFEGRIGSEVEIAELPVSWQKFLSAK